MFTLQQGTPTLVSSTSPPPSKTKQKNDVIVRRADCFRLQSSLRTLYQSSLLEILLGIETPSTPKFAKHLFRCYKEFGIHHLLLKHIWTILISQATTKETLFQKDSLCGELLRIYQLSVGHHYLHLLVGTFFEIQGQCQQSPSLSDDFGEFMFLFEGSIPEIPAYIFSLYSALFRQIKKKFGLFTMKKFIGIHFVKNFICVALHDPEEHLETKPPKETKKLGKWVGSLFQSLVVADKKLPNFIIPQEKDKLFTSQNHKSVNHLLLQFHSQKVKSTDTEAELWFLTLWEKFHSECKCSSRNSFQFSPKDRLKYNGTLFDTIQSPKSFRFLLKFLTENQSELQKIAEQEEEDIGKGCIDALIEECTRF